jgi:hypothetical protein
MTFVELKPHLKCTRCRHLGEAEVFASKYGCPLRSLAEAYA